MEGTSIRWAQRAKESSFYNMQTLRLYTYFDTTTIYNVPCYVRTNYLVPMAHHFAVFSPQHLSTQLASPLRVFAPSIQHPASNPGGLCFAFGFGNFGCFIFFSCALRWGFVLPFQRSLDCKFLVIDDSLTTNPSISLPILT